MGHGLETYSNFGRLMLATTDRLTKVLGQAAVTVDGSITIPPLLPGNAFWFSFRPDGSVFGNGMVIPPIFNHSGSTLSWTYQSTGKHMTGFVVYGQF